MSLEIVKFEEFRITSSDFDQLNADGKALIIFDGFDEMERRIDYQVTVENVLNIQIDKEVYRVNLYRQV